MISIGFGEHFPDINISFHREALWEKISQPTNLPQKKHVRQTHTYIGINHIKGTTKQAVVSAFCMFQCSKLRRVLYYYYYSDSLIVNDYAGVFAALQQAAATFDA